MSKFRFMKPGVDTVFVMLGRSCNLSCKYCLQHDVVNEHLSTDVNPDLVNFIAELAAASDRKVRVQFYGGEPLVYWPTITKIVNELKSLDANVVFSTITNGKLLTNDKVDFINENFDGIAVSWDGRNVVTTRGYDVVNDNRDQLFKLMNLCLSGVLSAYNYPLDFIVDFEAVNADYFAETGRTLTLNIDELLDVNLQNPDLKNFDYVELQSQVVAICQEYIAYATAGGEMSLPRLRWIQGKVNHLRGGLNAGKQRFARCGNGYSVLNVDLDGNLYRCHNTGDRVGTIYDDRQSVTATVARLDPTEANDARCSTCPVQFLCANGCPIVSDAARLDFYCRQVNAIDAPIIDMVLKFNDILR